ncbi:tectonic-1 [Arapaima gigas]
MQENRTVRASEQSGTEASSVSTTFPGEPDGVTQWTTAGSSAATQAAPLTRWSTAASAGPATSAPSQPLPVSGFLSPPVTKLSSVCPCDVVEGQCEVNCCCDQSCGGQTALFTDCSVPLLAQQLCSRDVVRYSLRALPDGAVRAHTSVQQESNADIFCIHTAKYETWRLFPDPEVPTDGNFHSLFGYFAGPYFESAQDSGNLETNNAQTISGYTYGDTIQVVDEMGTRELFKLPASGSTAHCLDTNPVAFLRDQSSHCIRTLDLAQDCATLPVLSLKHYINFRILSVSARITVNVEVSSITIQSLDGTLSSVDSPNAHLYGPILSESPSSTGHPTCQNAVLQVYYVVTYGETGAVISCAAFFVLGAVDSTMVPLQQEFKIKFVEVHYIIGAPTSGNPGYVVGLPLVAGSRTAEYPYFQNVFRTGSLTLLHSSSTQDCLGKSAFRSPILFGINMVSGCTLRLEDTINCTVVSELLLNILKGENYYQYVAGFGNSQPEMVMDWVRVRSQTIPTSVQGCSIPLSLDIEVQWTKYGSLLNPQAQIVNVTEIIRTNSSDLFLAGGNVLLPISTSVTFVDVSAPAQPGYKASPTIDAKLPFDFFFPFV